MPIKFNEVKQGEAIMYNNEIWVVFKKDLQTRGNLRSYYQVLLKNLARGNVYNQRFSPEDNVEQAMLLRDQYEFLYMDGDMLVVMHPETFDQINLHKDLAGEAVKFLMPNQQVTILSHNEKPLSIEMPQFVELVVTETPDAARGDTATSVFKNAQTDSGAEVKVPGHIKAGDRIRVRTEDGEFMGRVN